MVRRDGRFAQWRRASRKMGPGQYAASEPRVNTPVIFCRKRADQVAELAGRVLARIGRICREQLVVQSLRRKGL